MTTDEAWREWPVVLRAREDFPPGLGKNVAYDVSLPDGRTYRVFLNDDMPEEVAKEFARYEAWTSALLPPTL